MVLNWISLDEAVCKSVKGKPFHNTVHLGPPTEEMFSSLAAGILSVTDFKICFNAFCSGIVINFVPPIHEHESFVEFRVLSTAILLLCEHIEL
jgi:hypothetical protein